MEFKFRAGDHRPPPPPPQQYVPPWPLAVYCLSNQRFPEPCLRRTTDILDSNKEMLWEMELMRLREEKLLAEIERQRFLKEEARRELMLFEREMAIRGVAQLAGFPLRQPQRWGVPFSAAAAAPSPSSCPLPSPAVVVQSFHEWRKMEQAKSSDRLGFRAVALPPPPPPRIQPLMVEDKKELEVLEAVKRELIEKPDPNVFREKRKASTSLSTNDIQLSIVKKASKDEWSCVLYKVTTTNKMMFNQHLHGKKHQRKEASLRAQKEINISRAAPESLLKKRRKLCKATEMLSSAAVGAEAKESKHETLQGEKNDGSFDMNALVVPSFLKLGDKEDNKQQNNQITFGQNLIGEDDIVAEKKFNFWCEKCKVGAYDTKVMLAHVNGKKHQTNLKEVGQTGTGQPL
ncbi:uncharacterized protein LOC120080381 isoform X2 [Benincasa hispida]|uniref:uncharacterized protein LOC120080381 isoform X2 n=1 Tax=Benincasa hispida TaxID=102211 RepID=UPI00190276BC|nr:uncharacterized protein LOC120080381 isoform X2 [Benincasa hispida]